MEEREREERGIWGRDPAESRAELERKLTLAALEWMCVRLFMWWVRVLLIFSSDTHSINSDF